MTELYLVAWGYHQYAGKLDGDWKMVTTDREEALKFVREKEEEHFGHRKDWYVVYQLFPGGWKEIYSKSYYILSND